MPKQEDWFEFEKFEDGERQALINMARLNPGSSQLLEKVIRALHERDRVFALMFKAADTDQILLDMYSGVLDLMPECPVHGPKCASFQRDWIETMVKVEHLLNVATVARRMDLSEDHAWQPISPNTLPTGDLEKAINTGRDE